MNVMLHLGDCLEYMATMTGKSVDAIVGDLPQGKTGCDWDFIIPFEPMWTQVERVLKPGGVFITMANQPFTSMLVMSNLDWFKYEMIWHKSRPTGFLDCKRRPLPDHENILVFAPGAITYNPIMRRGQPSHDGGGTNSKQTDVYSAHKRPPTPSNRGLQFPRTVISIPSLGPTGSLHPTQKPLELYEYLILTYTNQDDTVLDFAMGSGTTGEACIRTCRNFIGCEIDGLFFAAAKDRIEAAQLQMPMWGA